MKYRLILTEKAMLDEMTAFQYYEGIRHGLGEKFLESLENRYAALSEHPGYYSYSDNNNTIRDVAVEGFPYLIIYEISGNAVVVFAV